MTPWVVYIIGIIISFVWLYAESYDEEPFSWQEISIGIAFSFGSWLSVLFIYIILTL